MFGISNVCSTLLRSLDNSTWTWDEVATGHLAGYRAGRVFSKTRHKVGMMKWMGNTLDTYRLYNQASSLGFFKRHPGLVKPLKGIAITVSIVNFIIASKSFWSSSKDSYVDNRLWNYTPKVLAVGTAALMVHEFQKHPMRAAAFFTAGVVTLADQVFENYSVLWSVTPWISRANQFWNGDWRLRGLITLKLVGKLEKIASSLL